MVVTLQFLLLLLLTYQSISKVQSEESERKPNIVIFIVDDLGYGDLGCFGNKTMLTPKIDSLASKGTKLNHVLAASAYCTPSRTAVLTGRYPVRTGMAPAKVAVNFFVAASSGIPPGTTTFPKLLQGDGYKTALVGKWHLGFSCNWWGDLCHHPNKQGFDHFYGLLLTNFREFQENVRKEDTIFMKLFPELVLIPYTIVIGLMSSAFIWYKRYKVISFTLLLLTVVFPAIIYAAVANFRRLNGFIMRNGDIVEQPLRLWTMGIRFVKESLDFIIKQQTEENPFLLMVTFTHVHAPLVVHPTFRGKTAHGSYGDSVLEVDWAVGKVLETLDRLRLRDNTIIVFTSDNGAHLEEIGPNGEQQGGSNFPLSGGKGMYGMEGGVRVPTIISWPGKIPEGRDLHVPSTLMDLYPTLLTMAGVQVPSEPPLDGKDLTQHLLKVQQLKSPHKFIFHYGRWDSIHAVTYVENETAVWKVHYVHPKWVPGTRRCAFMCSHEPETLVFLDEPQVYNIISDPSESHSLTKANPKRKQILATVQKAKADHVSSLGIVPQQMTALNSIWRPWLQPCCNFPFCSCQEAVEDILDMEASSS